MLIFGAPLELQKLHFDIMHPVMLKSNSYYEESTNYFNHLCLAYYFKENDMFESKAKIESWVMCGDRKA